PPRSWPAPATGAPRRRSRRPATPAGPWRAWRQYTGRPGVARSGRPAAPRGPDAGHAHDQADDRWPEREEEQEAGADGVRIGIGPPAERGQQDDRPQGPRPQDEEGEPVADPPRLQIVAHGPTRVDRQREYFATASGFRVTPRPGPVGTGRSPSASRRNAGLISSSM